MSLIRKIEVFDRTSGKKVVRYQIVADAGVDRITGQRGHVRRRFKTEREAREELRKLTDQASTDSFVPSATVVLRPRDDVGAEPLSKPNAMPGHRSRTSLMILALIIFFIIVLVSLGLYAGIAGRLTDQSISNHPDRPGPLAPHLVTEPHQPPPSLSRTRGSAPGPGQPVAHERSHDKRETYGTRAMQLLLDA
jgi:Arm DNA-binding domain